MWVSDEIGTVQRRLLGAVPVSDLAIHPEEPERLYAASPSLGVLRSDDRGSSWRRVLSEPVLAVAIPDDDVDRVLAGTIAGELLLSEDGGDVWDRVFVVDASRRAPVAIRRILVAPAEPGTVVLYSGDGRIYGRSGASWWADWTPDGRCFAVAMHPQCPDTLCAVTTEGVLLRDARQWRTLSRGYAHADVTIAFVPLPVAQIIIGGDVALLGGSSLRTPRVCPALRSVAADLDDPPNAYAVNSEGTLMRSYDAGASWLPVRRGWDQVQQLVVYGERPTF